MAYKWMGAALVVLACGGWGLSLSAAQKREEASLRQLMGILDFMECELQFRLTPLPELCALAGNQGSSMVHTVFSKLGQALETALYPEAEICAQQVLADFPYLPQSVRCAMEQMGRTLGRFDMEGQLRGLAAVRTRCARAADKLGDHQEERLRSYRTLGFCAGTALAILLV